MTVFHNQLIRFLKMQQLDLRELIHQHCARVTQVPRLAAPSLAWVSL